MTTSTRRGVLAAGALGALTACSSGGEDVGSRPTPSPTASSSGAGRADWGQLRRNVRGSLARPGGSRYDDVRLLQNPRYDGERPLAVLSVADAADVATGLAFAQDNGLPVALRSGGHSYPGWSGGGDPRALVIDCRPLGRVEVSGSTATVGAGATLAHVYDEIGSRGRAIAGGSCPTVGIGGLTLSTIYLEWPFSAAEQVIEAWQEWAPDADARLWSTLKAIGGETHAGSPTLLLSGTWTGPTSAFGGQLAGLLDQVPAPTTRVPHSRGYLEAMRAYAGSGARGAFAATSHVMYDRLDGAGIGDLIDQVQAAQSSGLKEAGVSIDALGGTVEDVKPDETAFVHREALATVQYTATFPPGSASDADAYVRGFRRAMLPHWGSHAYVNYADATIDDYRTAYFGDNAGRLGQVRAAYDPDHFFTQPQEL